MAEVNDMDDMIIKAKVDITKGRSDAFELAARRLGRFINAMDLDADVHNEMVELMCKQVNVAERDAFMFGFDMATKLMHDYYSDEEE